MTTIEEKRKGLEELRDNSKKRNKPDYPFYVGQYIGFNLGVELAQKEFLRFLEGYKFDMENMDIYINGEDGSEFCISDKIQELKKAVERKNG